MGAKFRSEVFLQTCHSLKFAHFIKVFENIVQIVQFP